MKTIIALLFAAILLRSSVSYSQTGYPGDIGTVRELPTDWWGLNSHDITHDDFELGANILNPSLHSIIDNWKKTKTEVLRYPGDGDVNDWDWLTGYYLTHGTYPPVHGQYNLDLHANTYFDLRKVANTMGAKITYALNPLSSDLHYQLAGLKLAQSLGFNVERIELGEELFGKSLLNQNSFETAADYADLCAEWIDAIKDASNFPQAKVAVVGADTSGDVRKTGWNVDVLTSPALIDENIDAVTIHYYPDAGLANGGVITIEEMDDLFMHCCEEAECLAADIAQVTKIESDAEIWITEYNLTDRDRIIHGSWAHALFATLQTMLMLEEEEITHATLQNASSDGVRGLLFQSIIGLTQYTYGGFEAPDPCEDLPCDDTNVLWDYTATGNSMRLFATAIRGMTNAAEVDFATAPYFGDDPNHKKIYAWIFADASDVSNATTRNAIIINLDQNAQYVDLSVFNMLDGQFEQLFSYDPAVFVGGSAVFGSDPQSAVTIQGFPTIHTTRNASLSSQKISSNNPSNFLLHPFSVTYLHFSINTPVVSPSAATICSGNSVTLKATGGCSYTWTVSPSTYTLDESEGNIISVHPETTGTYTFTATVKNKNGTVLGTPQATITVTSSPVFTVSTSSTGCNVNLNASVAGNYTWFPATGLSATTGQSVTATIEAQPRTYIVTATSGNCKYAQPVTASQIVNTGNQLAIPHLKRAYVAGCNNELYFKNDAANENAIYGIPIGGYIELDKYDQDGDLVSSDVIDASELASGTFVPCDVAGKYLVRYKYALPGCIEHGLEQTTFILGVEATATFTEICPDFALQITPDDNDSWDDFFWEPANSFLFEDKNGNNAVQAGTSYDKIYFISATPGTYTVTVNGSQAGNECSTNEYIVTVSDQCCTTGDNAFVDLTVSQLFDHLGKNKIICGTTYNGDTDFNNTVYFNGTLTVDQNANFLNTQASDLNLVFGKNAKVTIEEYRTLQWDDIHAYSCGTDMWTGIRMTKTETEVDIRNSTVEDAKQAIYLQNFGKYALDNVRFEDNREAITLYATTGAADFSESSLKRSTFITEDYLKAPYSGQWGERGIYVSSYLGNNPVTIGTSASGEENFFEKLRCGIHSYEQSVNIYGNRFKNIRANNSIYYSGKGVAATAHFHSATANVIGLGSTQPDPAFEDCDYGVGISRIANGTVSDQYMKNVITGTGSTGGLYSDLTFSSNKIENTNYGITSNLDLYSTLTITENNISVNPVTLGQAYSGISISDFTGSNSLPYISGNTVSNGRYGIYLLNTSADAIVEDNTINMTSATSGEGAVYGIYTEAANGSQLIRNTITGNTALYNSAWRKSGIILYQSQNCEVSCNKAIKIGRGFHLKGNCSSTIFKGNEMGVSGDDTKGNFYGIYREYFNGSDAFASQGDASNSHSNYAYGPFENANDWCAYHLNTVSQPVFFYNPNDPSYLQNFTQGPLAAFKFDFFPSTSAELYDCSQFGLRDNDGEMDTATVDSDPIKIGANEVEQWMNNRILYQSLVADTTQIIEAGLELFLDSTSHSGIGKLEEFTQSLKSDNALSNVGDLLSLNDDVQMELYYEGNEKIINEIFLNTVAIGIDTFSDQQKDFIQSMALSCPSADGIAVFKARSLYTMAYESLPYHDDSVCSKLAEKESNNKEQTGFNLFPNPASESSLIEFEEAPELGTEIILFDFLGREMLRLNMPMAARFLLLNLSDLCDGIYQVTSFHNHREISSRSLVIIQ